MTSESIRLYAKKSLLSILCLFSTGLLMPAQADAYLIKWAITDGPHTDEDLFTGAAMCAFAWTVVALPICLFNEQSPSPSSPQNAQDLLANGYSHVEVQLIMRDRNEFANRARRQHVALALRPGDTRSALERDVRSVYPAASKTFTDLLADQAQLK